MSVLLLPNTIGANADSLDTTGTTATGYELNDLISGPRPRRWRGVSSSSAVQVRYHLDVDVGIDYGVIARADWLVTSSGMRLRAVEKSSAGSWSYSAGVDYNTLVIGDLTGKSGQDLVFAINPTDLRGYGIECDSAGTEAAQMSKVYFSSSFTWGREPDQRPTFESIPDNSRYFVPQKSTIPYDTEKRFTLSWTGVTRAKVAEFRALPLIFGWPLFIYDTADAFIDWGLEHVILESFQEVRLDDYFSAVQATFLRLRHYA